jgi:hypothetical protein
MLAGPRFYRSLLADNSFSNPGSRFPSVRARSRLASRTNSRCLARRISAAAASARLFFKSARVPGTRRAAIANLLELQNLQFQAKGLSLKDKSEIPSSARGCPRSSSAPSTASSNGAKKAIASARNGVCSECHLRIRSFNCTASLAARSALSKVRSLSLRRPPGRGHNSKTRW